jgi:hypothetical protein
MLCIVGVLNASALSSKPRASRMFFKRLFEKNTYSIVAQKTRFHSKAGAKVLLFFDMTKYFVKKVQKYVFFVANPKIFA